MTSEAWYAPLLSSIPSGLIGAAVVYYFGLRQRAKERRFAFLERQLAEFYAPLAGLRKQIRAKSELRAKIQGLYPGGEEGLNALASTIDYHDKQFLEEFLPKYGQMLELFTSRYHLAEEHARLTPCFSSTSRSGTLGLQKPYHPMFSGSSITAKKR